MSIPGYIITCPKCGHEGISVEFSASCADECECPSCGETFVFEYPADEDEGD